MKQHDLENQVDTDLIVVNNEKTSPEKELVEDLISIIHVFLVEYGLKKYKGQIKKELKGE